MSKAKTKDVPEKLGGVDVVNLPHRIPADVVKPSVIFDGDKEHALITLFKGPEEDLPLVKSIGYMKLPNTNKYVSYVITTKGDKVVSFEVEQPDFRAIAEEGAKIAFVTNFMDQEI